MGCSILTGAILVCAVALPVAAQQSREQQNLQREARISMEQARRTALASQPGTITSSELEREHGKLIYSFDIKGRDHRTHEVHVDALTGKVIENKIETPAAEARERESEANAPGQRDPRHPPRYGEMRPGVVPPSITNTGEYAEDIYDAASAGNWAAARSRFPELRRAAAETARTAVPHAGAQEAQLESSVNALDRALSDRNRFAAMQEANRITLIAANLSERFHPAVPADVARLDYYGRELQIYAAKDNVRELRMTVDEMQRTWSRVRPEVEARGGLREARRFDSIMAQLETARNPAAYRRLAMQALDEVDRLEAVFMRPATA